jgi:hypothetical protein
MSRRQRRRRAKLQRHATARGRLDRERFVLQRVEDADAHWRRLWPSREQLAHAPQFLTAGVLSTGLAAQALAPAPCEPSPCVNVAGGGGAAVLPSEFGIDTVRTPLDHEPVVRVPMASGGTVGAYRTLWTFPFRT